MTVAIGAVTHVLLRFCVLNIVLLARKVIRVIHSCRYCRYCRYRDAVLPLAPVVCLCSVEHHVEEVEGGWQPDDYQDNQASLYLVFAPN